MAESLLHALLSIQEKAPKVQRDGINPYTESRYMTLDNVVAVVTPMLNEEGLLWQTRPSIDEHGRGVLRYRLTHVVSKEYIEDIMPLMLKQGTPQDQGSALTYARRYALVTVLNLVTDRDDDGHTATEAAKLPTPKRTTEPLPQPTEDQEKVLRDMVTELMSELKAYEKGWGEFTKWAGERGIDLEKIPADKLRPLERGLRSKLDRIKKAAEKQVATSVAESK